MEIIQPDSVSNEHRIDFPNGNTAFSITVASYTPISQVLSSFAMQQPKALFIIDGGSVQFDGPVKEHLRHLCSRSIARLAIEESATIIDDGIQLGISEMIGQSIAARNHQSVLLGVAPSEVIAYPGNLSISSLHEGAPLDQNHSHFVLVKGNNWGDEIDMMYQLVDELRVNDQGQRIPVVTILINGEEITKHKLFQSVQRGLPIIVVQGSGQLADDIAKLWQKKERTGKNSFISDPEMAEIVKEGDIHLFPLDGPPEQFEKLLKQLIYQTAVSKMVWDRFALYDTNANRLQKQINWMELLAVAIVTLAIILLLTQAFPRLLGNLNILYAPTLIFRIISVLIPIIVTVLILWSRYFISSKKLDSLRASAEAIKREIFYYRTRTGNYIENKTPPTHSLVPLPNLLREEKLVERVGEIGIQLMQTEAKTMSLHRYAGPIPPITYGVEKNDDGYSQLTPETYIAIRIDGQTSSFRGKLRWLKIKSNFYYGLALAAIISSALFAAISFEPLVILMAGLTAALATYLEFRHADNSIIKYNQVIIGLENVKHFWRGLRENEQMKHFDQLVSSAELILETGYLHEIEQIYEVVKTLRASQYVPPGTTNIEVTDSVLGEFARLFVKLSDYERQEILTDLRSKAGDINNKTEQSNQEREGIDAKKISAWISEHIETPKEPLLRGETYTLNFKVGQPFISSLINSPGTIVASEDVPLEGLDTQWVITAQSIVFDAISSGIMITHPLDDPHTWMAQFTLHIPKDEDSVVQQLRITPLITKNTCLQANIFARGELYRQFLVELVVAEAEVLTEQQQISTVESHEIVHSPAKQLNLVPSRIWQRPPGKLLIVVNNTNLAFGMGQIVQDGILTDIAKPIDWRPANLVGIVDSLRKAAEKFSSEAEEYLNNIDPMDLMFRLSHFEPQYNWASLIDQSDVSHKNAWERMKNSAKLRNLATEGFTLYERIFPRNTDQRSWLDSLRVGHRLDIIWQNYDGSSIPWGLIYMRDPNDSIDPFSFMGLRFRIHYSKHAFDYSLRHLGSIDETYQAHCLYWGDPAHDTKKTALEARWQKSILAKSANQVFIPDEQITASPKQTLLKLLYSPEPIPTRVLYFFCQSSTTRGVSQPMLRFGNTNSPEDRITRDELPRAPQLDHPLVFANACGTSASDGYFANELERLFFDRHASAYIGTETKVPIQFASRFAAIFFRFFYRRVDPAPIAAGEAIAQTRLFLWTQYQNIGGLLYTYINQYELFMANEAEINLLAQLE